MRNIVSRAIASALLLALPLSAQAPPTDIPATIGETIDVRVVNVEAVVTNAAGERVRGLAAADFRLLVDGKEAPIDYFAEIAEGKSVSAQNAPVAAGEEVGRNYLVYIDDAFSLANRRNDVMEKLERDLGLLGPADRMAVLAFDGARTSLLSSWTRDLGALKAALAQARERQAQGGEMLAHQRKLQADVDSMVDNADSIDTGDSDNVGGIKVHELDVAFEWMGKRISPEARTQLGKTTDAAIAALRGFETPPGRKVLLLLSGAWSLSVAPQLYGPFVQTANQLGYTVYPVDASQSDPHEASALDALARATGGRLLAKANDRAFQEIVEDSGTYYWLGFTPAWKADDRRHAVTVEVRRPGLAVRSRGGFSDVSGRTQAAAKAEGVLLFGGAAADRRLIVELGEPRRREGAYEVPVTLGVPVEALALTPQGKEFLAEVPLAISTQEEDGRRSNLSGLRLKVVVPAAPKPGTYARFQTVVRLRDPRQRLILSVPDPVGGHVLWGEASPAPAKGK